MEVAILVADREVGLVQFALMRIERQLGTSKPTLVTGTRRVGGERWPFNTGRHLPEHQRAVHYSSVVERVKVKVGVGVEAVAFEGGLKCARLFARLRGDVGIDLKLGALEQLVFERELGQDGVVGSPLLLESAAPVAKQVLGLELGIHAAGLVDGDAVHGKLDIVLGLRFDVELHQAEI